jgi:hypothetical protein
MGRCTLRFESPTKTNEKKAYDYIEDRDYGTKYSSDYIDLGIVEYRAITFKKVAVKTPPSYKLKFAVYEKISRSEEKLLKSFDEKPKADDYAFGMALKELQREYFVAKEYVLEKGDSVVTKIENEVKVYKKEPKLKPQKNRIVVPMHKYIFYGVASS